MAQTKDQIIKSLKGQIKEFTGQLAEDMQRNGELQAEIDECSGMNGRLNKTLAKEREKIGKLKDVARFFRAQRDRVDAYLSALIDEAEKRSPKEVFGPSFADERVSTASMASAVPELNYSRRPRVNEPSAMAGDDGRNFSPYRDDEPRESWEDF